MTKSLALCLISIGCLLTACASSNNWRHGHVNSGTSDFSSSRLSYTNPNPSQGMDLEIIRTNKASRGYLAVHSHPILPYEKDPKKALVSLQIEHESFSCIASRHEGGHRVLLPEEIVQKIILSLMNGKEVLIETSGYKAQISPEGFSDHYLKFQNPSNMKNLIKMPI